MTDESRIAELQREVMRLGHAKSLAEEAIEMYRQRAERLELELTELRAVVPYVLCDTDNQRTCELARAAMARLDTFYCRCHEPLGLGLHHEDCPAQWLHR